MNGKEIYSIAKEKLGEIVASFKRYEIYSPQLQDGVIQFQKMTPDSDITLANANSQNPPKHVVLPQADALFNYTLEDGFQAEEKIEKMGKTVIFGIRNCDARAIVYLDKVMLEGHFQDVYYKSKREKTVLIGLACNRPPYTDCFCTSVGGGPHCTEGLDIQLIELKNFYLLAPITDKGKKLLETVPSDLLKEATQQQREQKGELDRDANNSITRHLNVEGTYEIMSDNFDDKYWKRVSDPCIGCGICTFLCPTCFCFDINDIGDRKKGQRIRVWDTCQFPEYSIHASGHNPRPTKSERQRQRFYHKYKYSIDNQQMIGCVGCSRCINLCPVNIDIVEVIDGVKGLKGVEE